MQAQPDNIEAMEQQMDSVTDLYNLLTRSCVAKCSTALAQEGNLRIRETVCLDRCVAKFFAANDAISNVMKRYQERQEASQQAEQRINASTGSITSVLGL